MSRVTKVYKKTNGQFGQPVPIGTSSQYVTVNSNGTTLQQILGDVNELQEQLEQNDLTSSILKVAEVAGTSIDEATTEKSGLMSAIDFKKINPIMLQEGDDLNNIKTIGWYRVPAGVANRPISTTVGWMEVQQLANGNFFQRFRNSNSNGTYYERIYTITNLWSSWKQLDAPMQGATSTTNGQSGYVPQPTAGKQNSFLRGDGTWATPTNTWVANSASSAGYVASPNSQANRVWMTNNSGVPAWRTISNMTGATTSNAGTSGLVPAPAKGRGSYLLSGAGTWVKPPETNGGSISGLLLTQNQYNNISQITKGFTKSSLDLTPASTATHGGLIDFHFKGASSYTSRLVENKKGQIKVSNDFQVGGSTSLQTLTAGSTVVSSFTNNGNANLKGTTTFNGSVVFNKGVTINDDMNVRGSITVPNRVTGSGGYSPIVSPTSTTGEVYVLNSSGGTYLQVTGRWGASSGSSTKNININTSDIRLKQNIKKSNVEALKIINKIPLYEFDWKETKQHQKIGFIANELEKIDSNLSIGKEEYDKNGNPVYKSVNSFYLQGYEVKAIQELSSQNKKLLEKIEKLQEEIKQLKNK